MEKERILFSGYGNRGQKAIGKRWKSSKKLVKIPRVKAQFYPALCYLCRREADMDGVI